MAAPELLERIDRIMAELAELRAAVAGAEADFGRPPAETDDLSEANLIEISQAVERFNRPPDSLRWMCRHRDCGVKRGGRWLASAPRLTRYLNGGG